MFFSFWVYYSNYVRIWILGMVILENFWGLKFFKVEIENDLLWI